MTALVRLVRFLPLAAMVALLGVIAGCTQRAPAPSKDAGTTSQLGLPESDPPVLTRAAADRIKPGMSQDEALAILQDAARNTPSAKSSIDTAVTQGKLNNIRYDLTIRQGKRKLVMNFRDGKLVDKTQEGLE
jgi:hypothetical protein